jgi:hypothetical protein
VSDQHDRSPLKTASGENLVLQKNDTHEFHDSESEDVYDLYNACNGELHNGLLDIRKLDELSQEESAALNIARLSEIWAHTATGCLQCEEIITTLNSARRVLGECVAAVPAGKQDHPAARSTPKTIIDAW